MLRDRVHLVPAGVEAWSKNQLTAYVKFGRPKKLGLTRYRTNLQVIGLPDRTVYLAALNSGKKTLIDNLGPFDQVVPLLSPEVVKEPIVLINPYHTKGTYDLSLQPWVKQVIVDSGGFQMLRGTADFIDPDNLVEFYNQHATICMPLDLPLPSDVEPYYFDAVTKMMRANDQYMEPLLEKGRVLALVSHGSNVSNRLRRIDGLKRKSPVVAIAGLNTLVEGDSFQKIMTALTNGLAVIDHVRKDTKYFHFLGVTSNFWFILYAIMVGTGYVERCGGDSVSFRMSSINGTYNYGLGGKGARSDDVVRTQLTPVGTTCRCPLCRTVTDQRLFLNTVVMECHNIWNAIETKNLIVDSVQVYLDGKCTLRTLADQWLPAGRYELLARAVSYLEEVIQKGYREWKPKKTKSLFERKTKHTPEGLGHYETIIRRYEEFHKKKFLT